MKKNKTYILMLLWISLGVILIYILYKTFKVFSWKYIDKKTNLAYYISINSKGAVGLIKSYSAFCVKGVFNNTAIIHFNYRFTRGTNVY